MRRFSMNDQGQARYLFTSKLRYHIAWRSMTVRKLEIGVIIKTMAAALALGVILTAQEAFAQENICAAVDGAVIISNDGTYLGKIVNKYESNSIFNKYGEYGNKFNSDSIWNNYGTNGNEYNPNSWRNSYSSTPPAIMKNSSIIGYLSRNSHLRGALNPIVIGVTCYGYEPS